MEQKEKAKELIKKFEDLSLHFEDSIYETAQHNALICVDEIQKVRQKETISDDGLSIIIIPDIYWLNVKKEIEEISFEDWKKIESKNICTDTGKNCLHKCSGLCKERC